MSRRAKLGVLVLALFVVVALAAPLVIRNRGEKASRAAADRFAAVVWPLEIAAHTLPAVPAEENAAHWLQAAAKAVVLTADDRLLLRHAYFRRPQDPANENDVRAAALVEANNAALDLAHRMADLPRSSFELAYADLYGMEIPNLMEIRDTELLLSAEVRLRLDQGRPAEAIRALGAIRSAAAACQRESPLIFQLIGLAVERTAWRSAQEVVARGGATPEALTALRQPLLDTTLDEQLRRAIGAEALAVHLTDDRMLVHESTFRVSSYLKPFARWIGPWVDAQVLDYYSDFFAAADDTPVHPGFFASHTGLIVHLDDYPRRFHLQAAIRQLGEVAVALYGAARNSGRYPPTLTAYDAASNPYTGEALDYRIEPDGSAVLSIPGALELWRSQQPPGRPRSAPVDEPWVLWQLPPVGPAVESAGVS